MIEVVDLYKSFNDHEVLRGVNLKGRRGTNPGLDRRQWEGEIGTPQAYYRPYKTRSGQDINKQSGYQQAEEESY